MNNARMAGQSNLLRLFYHGNRLGHLGCLGLVALSLMLGGCVTYKQNAGKLLASTALTVDAAMRSWATVVKMGKATDEQQAKVRAAYEKYQMAMTVADAAYTALVSLDDKSLWPLASSQLTDASTSLTTLIQSSK